MRVALVPNTGKPDALQATVELADRLTAAGYEPVLASGDAAAAGLVNHDAGSDTLGPVDLAVALGGDGTIIKAVHLLGEQDTPLLGVNFGRLGFLSGASPEGIHEAVDAALSGSLREERRSTLSAVTVDETGAESAPYVALNEVFVGRRGGSRVVDLELDVGDTHVVTYTCDGVIVASPTGSTAYALSAGGPIVSPEVQAMLIVPVAPHTLADRALVLSGTEPLTIGCPAGRASSVCVTVDGQEALCTTALRSVRVWRGARDVRLLKLDGRDFLEVASEKFLRG